MLKLLIICFITIQVFANTQKRENKHTSKNAYWLIAESEHLKHEYGLNDAMGYSEEEGGRHYYQLPSNTFLKEGINSAYIRFKPLENIDLIKKSNAFVTLNLQIMNLKSRKIETVKLLSLKYDTNRSGFLIEKNTPTNNEIIKINPNIRFLKAMPSQRKNYGYEVSFSLNDNFYTLPYLNAETMNITPKLEIKVKEAMQRLLKLYQARDYDSIVKEYDLSWSHIAKSYDYGKKAKDYSDNIKFKEDLDNPKYTFFLDFSKSKLKIRAKGKLIGFHPSVLIGKESDGFEAIDFPVYFMKSKDGKLKISG